MEQILELAQKWEQGGVITQEDAHLIYELLEPYLEYEFNQISALSSQGEPEAGLGVLVKTTNFLSASGNKVPGIITKLQKTIKKYQGHARNLGQKLGADSLTISVGFPSGVSVSLTWAI